MFCSQPKKKRSFLEKKQSRQTSKECLNVSFFKARFCKNWQWLIGWHCWWTKKRLKADWCCNRQECNHLRASISQGAPDSCQSDVPIGNWWEKQWPTKLNGRGIWKVTVPNWQRRAGDGLRSVRCIGGGELRYALWREYWSVSKHQPTGKIEDEGNQRQPAIGQMAEIGYRFCCQPETVK